MEKEERFKAHPIVTEVQMARKFWPAEDYHQQYIETNGGHCHVNLRAAFRSIGKDMPKRGLWLYCSIKINLKCKCKLRSLILQVAASGASSMALAALKVSSQPSLATNKAKSKILSTWRCAPVRLAMRKACKSFSSLLRSILKLSASSFSTCTTPQR